MDSWANQDSYLSIPYAEGFAEMTVGLQNSILDGIIDDSTTEMKPVNYLW